MGGNGTASGFSDISNEAVEWYVSGDGMWINQYLRGKDGFGELTSQEKELLKGLDTATNNKITADTLYRAVDAQAVFGSMSDDDFYNLENALVYQSKDKFSQDALNRLAKSAVGKTITERGFMSTTTDRNLARDWNGFTGSNKDIVIQFEKPKNLKGKNLTKHSMQQSEILLKRGQKYTVTGVSGKDGKIWITAKFV